MITFNRNYFPERFPHPGKYSYETPHEYWLEQTEEEIIRLSLCHTIFINFYSCMYHNLKRCLNRRSRHQRCSIEKAVLKNFLIFTRKQLRWSLFLIQLQTQAWKPATVLKETLTKYFSVTIAKILRTPIFKKICKQPLQFLLLTVNNFS